MTEERPNPESRDMAALKEQIGELNRKIDVLEERMNTQKSDLQGDIRE